MRSATELVGLAVAIAVMLIVGLPALIIMTAVSVVYSAAEELFGG